MSRTPQPQFDLILVPSGALSPWTRATLCSSVKFYFIHCFSMPNNNRIYTCYRGYASEGFPWNRKGHCTVKNMHNCLGGGGGVEGEIECQTRHHQHWQKCTPICSDMALVDSFDSENWQNVHTLISLTVKTDKMYTHWSVLQWKLTKCTHTDQFYNIKCGQDWFTTVQDSTTRQQSVKQWHPKCSTRCRGAYNSHWHPSASCHK